jgi:O-antigen/teichoic acid export membrane protein
LLLAAWVFLSTWHQFLAEAMRGCHEQRFANLFCGELGGPVINGLFCASLGIAALAGQLTLSVCLALIVGIHLLLLPLSVLLFVRTARRSLGAVIGTKQLSSQDSPRGVYLQLRVCLPLMCLGALSYLVARGDLWIADYFCTHDDLALYAAARRVVQLVAIPLALVTMAALPTIAEGLVQRRHAELERVLRSSATLASIPSLLACAALVVCPALILTLLLGPAYAAAAPIAGCLVIGQAVYMLTGTGAYTLMMADRQQLVLAINLATGILFAICGVLGARSHGAIGLALAASLAMALQNIVCWLAVHRVLGIWTHVSWCDALSLGRTVGRTVRSLLVPASPASVITGEVIGSGIDSFSALAGATPVVVPGGVPRRKDQEF